ncbi:MAG: metal ABC transporter permease [Armatimonadota bacterium]|nr:metal ABC transporter permease [bacterium]
MEILGFGFMQRALIAGALIGTLCAVVGVYVVLRGLAFMGAGISHTSLGGVAIGVLLGVNPIWSAVVFGVLTGWAIGFASRRGQVREDTAIGIFFASGMALGVMLIGLRQGYQVDLLSYLFGSITAVTIQDVWTTVVITILVLGAVIVLFKDLMFSIFDPEMAQVTGVPADKLYYLLITMIALTVVISIKVVGIVLVSALIVIPAAAAYQLTESFRKMMALSIVFGAGSTIAGLLLSAVLRISSGATIVLLATVIFGLCALFSPRRRRGKEAVL